MKKTAIKLGVVLLALTIVFSSCSKAPSSVSIETFDGNVVEVSTEGLSSEQIDALNEAAQSGNSLSLIQSGLFTNEELSELGLFNGGAMGGERPEGMMQDFDFSDVSIDDLNTEDLTQEQISKLKEILSGEMTVENALAEGVFAIEDLQTIGLISSEFSFNGDGADGFEGRIPLEEDFSNVDINDLETEGLSQEQLAALQELISGEKTLNDLLEEGVFDIQELQNIGLISQTQPSQAP